MATISVYCCVIISLFQLVCGNVPVLLWESSRSNRVNSFPAFHRISQNEFQQYILKKVHGEKPVPLIAIFAEERLSMEDFSWQDSQGQAHFPQLKYIAENADSTEIMPSVQNPIGAIEELSAKKGFKNIQTVDPSKIADFPDGCGKVLMVKLPEAKPEEYRADLLRQHDVKIAEAYSQLLSKCSHVIGILSGRQASWVEPEEVTRLRRSTDDNSTSVTGPYTLYQDQRGVSMLFSREVPKLFIDSKEISLQNYTVVISGDNSKPNDIKLFAKYGNEYRITFNFDNKTNGYWYLRSVDLTIIAQNENYILKSMLDINAPLGMSYHCGTAVVFRNGTKELVFSDLQVEPFFFKAGSKSFSDAVDEVPFFTPAIWSGIFVTFLLALIFTWGISMIMDIRTMDQFDDPKGKTITVSATD